MRLTRKGLWTKTMMMFNVFLPKSGKSAGFTRPYLAVGALLFSLLVLLLNILSYTITQDRPVIVLYSSLIIWVVICACLAALKVGVRQEIVTGSFQAILTTAITFLLVSFGGSFYAPGIFFFMVTILHSSLFSSYRLALIQSAYVIAGTIFIFWKVNAFGYSIPFEWPFDVYVDRLHFVIIIVSLTTYFAMALHEYFRKSAQQAMVGERAWLLRSSRLHEVSTLAESLSFQIYSPLREFGRDFGRLKNALGSESFDTLESERVRAMDRSVEELIQISRSFDWIYRGHKHDFLSGASIDLVLRNLRILLEGKALENGWVLRFQSDHPDRQITGDIPSLMLLFVTLAHRNFDRYSSSQSMALNLSASISDDGKGAVVWRMNWPKTGEKNAFFRFDSPRESLSKMVDEIRQSLLEELVRDCHASLDQRMSETHHEITISFPQSP
ncbi:MAG: hypothetical protein H7318_12970 [Oligoflexus sp.]|nr:hypothetical protein [Oligoflexus sp.]